MLRLLIMFIYQELEDCTVTPTVLHVQLSPYRRLFYVHISFVFFVLCSAVFSFLYCNDVVCQQITVQTVKA